MITLDKLHDATFDRLEISWASGEAMFYLRAFIGGKATSLEIALEGLTSLTAPRFQPWGPSTSINKAWEENSGEAIKLTIEMQSGDIIEARAKKYTVQNASAK